ncbi:DUF4404 family protein [Bermanella marisrubri]|uniref:Chromosome segregation ATPase n=1 Tax=Bermanella marisrubri TaxID=207949 RepID=Q1N339_9GAMM|nr:DUF4404 family protein [Bermanella marisrubri]EAT12752.1 hypothetical protein RED65_13747 [Oceanobacter sp. RED65] [Bermanella marisrubri]QIZ85132.1 DUF4404 family protein [Bermanella marisrubri]
MKESLKQHLEQLHDTLSKGEPLDSESKDLLKQLDADIQKVLSGEEDEGLSYRLEQQAVDFEGQHPQLSAILRDIMDALSKMGI